MRRDTTHPCHMATVVVFSCGLIYIYILHCETSFICYFRAVTTVVTTSYQSGNLPWSTQNAIGNLKIGNLPVDIILCLSSILLNKNTTLSSERTVFNLVNRCDIIYMMTRT